MEARFIVLERGYQPDLIVSVLPGFVGCAIDLLEQHGLWIPFVPLIADLVTISSLWVGKRSFRTVSPTIEATQKLREMGIPAVVAPELGFPIRRCFETAPPVFDRRIERRKAGGLLEIFVFATLSRRPVPANSSLSCSGSRNRGSQ